MESTKILESYYASCLREVCPDPLITINCDGMIMDLNDATSKITGLTRDKLIGSDFGTYFTDSQKVCNAYHEVFSNGFVKNIPLIINNSDFTDVLLNGSVFKNEQGVILGAVVVIRDISKLKRIEKEMADTKVFARKAVEFAENAKRRAENSTRMAEDSVKAKQQFLSNMSHEIRTPMNAIIGFTKVALKTNLTPKQKDYLTAIKLSGDSLIVLLNDILDLAKVEAGKMTFEQTPFKMMFSISTIIHIFESKVQEKNMDMVKEYDEKIPEVLLGDPTRLHQILLNLVSNAVKFTPSGKITISVKLINEDEEKVSLEFSVKDTGIGIAEDKITKIFENFQQASDDTSRMYGGTGLGLAIVKQLVERQNGTIRVKSKLNEGSTFSFILNFLKTNAEAKSDTGVIELKSDFKNINVLVVEDMALNQLLMKTLLDDFGFERDIASNGLIAIEKLKARSYDIILMDLHMPEMNGFEATEYIRKTMKLSIPIIALTADVTTVDLEMCTAVGMNDYISKPIDERLMYSKIIGLVKSHDITKIQDNKEDEMIEVQRRKFTDLTFLIHCTKSNPVLMKQMISLYLKQTPPLVDSLKQSFEVKDWLALQTAAHKMLPSFSIMGISKNFENIAKKIKEYAIVQQQTDDIPDLILQIDNTCKQAYIELEDELETIKNTIYES